MRATSGATRPEARPSRWRTFLKVCLVALAAVLVAGTGVAVGLHWKFVGARNLGDYIQKLPETTVVLRDPRAYFPGRDRITVLCLGLDRNIFKTRDPRLRHLNGMPYTKGARTDVMMVASLDLANRAVSILSIPRDTRVELPSGKWAKINQAHADGGIPYTRETVEKFLGVPIDYHVVIKQEAIQQVVDALGGLKLRVEKDMDYEDRWGQLFIHLKEGEQVLNGEQVVGYMRFRHDREGDFGRIRRQQQVIQALSEQVKSPAVLLKAAALIDAIRSSVQTDLTPEQQLALAHLFHRVDPARIQTAQLPIADDVMIGGVSYLEPDEEGKEAVVDWILRGNREAMNRLIRVSLKNASGDPELYERVYRCLRAYGFRVYRSGRAPGEPRPTTRAVQHTNLSGAARRVLEVLGLPGAVEKEPEGGPDVTLYVGEDLEHNAVLAASELWPAPPPAAMRLASRSAERPRRRRRSRPEVHVEIRPADASESALPAPPTPPLESAPGAPAAELAPADAPPSEPNPAPEME